MAIFREPLRPTPERIKFMLSVMKGWLLDRWSIEQAECAARTHANAVVGEAMLANTGFDPAQ